jgi:hypothetical protein
MFFIPFILFLLLSQSAKAEVWLTDNLYIENQQHIQLESLNDGSSNTNNFRFLPELSVIQNIPTSSLINEVTLGGKFDLQQSHAKAHSQAIVNQLNIKTAINPYWSFTLGRQKIAYSQPDLFNTSLNKNDLRQTPLKDLSFSQGLLTTLRLGVMEQSLLLSQKNEKEGSKPSYHYQLKLGIPGYKAGPLVLLLSQENNAKNQKNSRAMIGSALQLPLKFIVGDWQWAFQYASELENRSAERQHAWQTSFSWLGFIPNHKAGILFSHTDQYWSYSDDFNPNTQRTELRYQWLVIQRLDIGLATSKNKINLINSNKTLYEMAVSINFAL